MAGKNMAIEQKLMEKAGIILQEKGHVAVELARERILEEHLEYAPLNDALRYFIRDWNDVLHPALVWLSCEAVGGEPDKTVHMGAALVLLAGGADIHDDVIDESLIKGAERTIFGKFGKDIAILVGDTLLIKGAYLLHEACENLEATKRKKILDIVKEAFIEISNSEAREAGLRGRMDVPKQKYLDIIRHKVAAGEAAARIGALMGNGTQEEVEALASFGRSFGVLMSVRDEFIDIFEQDELLNRIDKEVLPLPIMVTLADESRRAELLQLLNGKITDSEVEKIVEIVTAGREGLILVSEMRQITEDVSHRIQILRCCKEDFELLAAAALEDL